MITWFKEHWNEPITVGGYTKMCLLAFVASCAVAVAEVAYFGFKWWDWGDKLVEIGSGIVHKFNKSER